MRRKNVGGASGYSHPPMPHQALALLLRRRWGASVTLFLFFFLSKAKIHLGSATDFREMVPKPGPSKPGAQKPLGARTNQCLLLIGYQASLSDLLFLLSSLSIYPNVPIRETGPNCRPHPQVGRNGKQSKARGTGEGRQEFVCSVVLRLHTLIVCLE